MQPDRSNAARACSECTACCDGWLRINVRGHDVSPGNPCRFSVAHKCSIYADRPVDPCQKFICGWLADSSPLPEWMRPDKANLILLAANFQWRGIPVHVAVAVGPRPKEKAINWLKEFCLQSQRPLIFQSDGEWTAYGPPQFQTEMAERLSSGKNPWT
jgi:hypothetical protein